MAANAWQKQGFFEYYSCRWCLQTTYFLVLINHSQNKGMGFTKTNGGLLTEKLVIATGWNVAIKSTLG